LYAREHSALNLYIYFYSLPFLAYIASPAPRNRSNKFLIQQPILLLHLFLPHIRVENSGNPPNRETGPFGNLLVPQTLKMEMDDFHMARAKVL